MRFRWPTTFAVVFLAGIALGGGAYAANEEPRAPLPNYAVTFDAKIVPSERSAEVEIRLGADASPVEWMLLRDDPMRHQAFEADGELIREEEGLRWIPPKGGGALRYVFSIDQQREPGLFDARCARNWALFRGDDLVPQIRIRTVPIARSRSRLRLQLPEGWSAALPYPRTTTGAYRVSDPDTRFDRPAGWFLLGELGVLREEIATTRVVLAAPVRHGARRMDMMALLRWTLPTLHQVVGRTPERLLLTSVGDPMWRGGLSGHESVYLHAERPLIEEDGTSPLLHELIHTLMSARAGRGGDWIVEGLAEWYSLEVLRRTGTLSASRYETALERMTEKAKGAGKLRVASVKPATKARAVLILRELDAAIRAAREDEASLDDVVRLLVEEGRPIVTSRFIELCEDVAGLALRSDFERLGVSIPPNTRSPAERVESPDASSDESEENP